MSTRSCLFQHLSEPLLDLVALLVLIGAGQVVPGVVEVELLAPEVHASLPHLLHHGDDVRAEDVPGALAGQEHAAL